MRKRYRTAMEEELPESIKLVMDGKEIEYEKYISLRYGANPHQPAAFYRTKGGPHVVGGMNILKSGKGGLSQTNVEDINNSIKIVSYFKEPSCAVMKHLNPSGVSTRGNPHDDVKDIYIRARDSDSLAAFGSVVGFNTKVDANTAEEILSTYVEVVVAPGFDEDALDLFQSSKNLRVIAADNINQLKLYSGEAPRPLHVSMLSDGSIILSHPMLTRIRGQEDLKHVTDREATEREIQDLIFSWYVCMNVRSNGVVLSRDNATIGIGTGQQDRVTAVELAIDKASSRGHKEKIPGSVLASDGFFPFRDSIDLLAENGVTACIQPGGSIRDEEVIEACNENSIAMFFTEERCFSHF
jgi:phosphoribosylaminoimidazolecarboxamide formyltransferase/IMP cyclohydrolase